MNDRGYYGNVVGVTPRDPEQPSREFSWGGLAFFALVGGGLLLLVRPHYEEARELARARARSSQHQPDRR